MDSSSSKIVRSDAALAFVILGLGCFLAFTGAGLIGRWQHSASRRQSIAFEDLLGFVAVAAGLVIVAWWVLSLLAAFGAAVLAQAGRKHAAALTGRFSPAFMRRLALGALGMQLIGAPLAHADASQAPGLSPNYSVAVAAAWAPTQDQRADSPLRSSVGMAFAAEPAQENLTGPRVPRTSDVRPQWQPHPPVSAPRLVTSTPARATNNQPHLPQLVVRAGDSLWTIAATHLGPEATDIEIAREWPRWFRANIATIGSNPDVLLPGQILRAP